VFQRFFVVFLCLLPLAFSGKAVSDGTVNIPQLEGVFSEKRRPEVKFYGVVKVPFGLMELGEVVVGFVSTDGAPT